MSRYLRSVPEVRTATAQEPDEMPEMTDKHDTKPRAARGTSPYAQCKVRRDLFESLSVVGKMNSLKTWEVIEKILELHVGEVNEALEALKLTKIF
jgi:hypothetical protein